MLSDGIGATVTGIPDLKAALLSIPDKLRKRALRNALAAAGRVVRDDAKRNAPVLSVSMRSKVRTPGTVKKAISVRTSKEARRAGDVGVFVNVRPAKKGARGANSPSDPFYWRFLEFGWTPATGPRSKAGVRARAKVRRSGGAPQIQGVRFLTNASERLGEALRVFMAQIGPQIMKLNGGKDVQL